MKSYIPIQTSIKLEIVARFFESVHDTFHVQNAQACSFRIVRDFG